MLETIRQYAAERLEESGEAGSDAKRHLAHYLHIAGAGRRPRSGPRGCSSTSPRAGLRPGQLSGRHWPTRCSRAKESDRTRQQAFRLANGLNVLAHPQQFYRGPRLADEGVRRVAGPRAQRTARRGTHACGNADPLTGRPGRGHAALKESVALRERLSPPDDAGHAAALWRIAHARLNAGFAGEA